MRCFLLLVAVIVVGCEANTEPSQSQGNSVSKCVPNQTLVCLCGLDEGQQTCTADHTLTECQCPTHAESSPASPPPSSPKPAPKATCGDGKVDPGEACDDGNTESGDGCSSRCEPDGAPTVADTCPGQIITVWKGSSLRLVGTTAGYTDRESTSCYPSEGPDRIYTIQPSEDGFLNIDAAFASGFNAVVEIRRGTCGLSTANVLCEDTLSRPFKRVLEVEKDKNYFLIVDGDTASAKGAYTIDLELL